MPSYVITGGNRGIGLAFIQNLSSNPSNTVISIVRNVAETEAKISSWKTPNVHILEGDLNSYESLKKAAAATSIITSGSLDVLIANAAFLTSWSAFDPLSVLGQDPDHLTRDLTDSFNTNVVGNIHLYNLFLPLILKGKIRKVVAITTGLADIDLTLKYGLYEAAPYAISKAAMNMATAKFQAEYEKDGVLFIGISPGVVDTGATTSFTEDQMQKLAIQGAKFAKYAPHFKGPIQPEESAIAVLSVIEKASLANGDGGAFVSHLGTKQWL